MQHAPEDLLYLATSLKQLLDTFTQKASKKRDIENARDTY